MRDEVKGFIAQADSLNDFMNVLRSRVAEIVSKLKLEHVNMKMVSLSSPTITKAIPADQKPTSNS